MRKGEEEKKWAVHARAFHLPKAGHRAEEYEDAFACSEGAALPFYAAVADGATESAFARVWARALADGFVAAEAALLKTHLPAWQSAWKASVEEKRGKGLPWYAAAKAEEGAFAAFLGLALEADGRYRAQAVGDCCLFHLRSEETRLRWPLEAPEAFHHRPALLPSRANRPAPDAQRCEGTFQPGDTFLLATDALAQWLMRDDPVEHARTTERFQKRVEAARASGTLRNDDVTLLVLEVKASSASVKRET